MNIKDVLKKINSDEESGHLSHSQVNMMLRCPRSYHYRYIKGIKIPPAGAIIQGSSYHAGMEQGYKYKLENKGRSPSLQMIQDAADRHWQERQRVEEKIDWQGNPGLLKDEVMTLLNNYVSNVMPTIIPIAVEQRESLEVAGIPFVRVIDLKTKNGVIDHKVSGRRYGDDAIYTDIQSCAYLYPKGGKFEFHVALKTNKKDIQIFQIERTKKDIRWWEDLVERVALQIKTGIFPPNPGGWFCSPNFCGYWKLCREGKELD